MLFGEVAVGVANDVIVAMDESGDEAGTRFTFGFGFGFGIGLASVGVDMPSRPGISA